MEFEVREAETAQDLDFIAERFEETVSLWEDYAPTPESIATQRERVATWLADPKAHITVAVTPDDQVLGFNSLYLTQDYDGTPLGKIVILYVHPDHRGQGVARRLKLEGEDWLRTQGARQVVTEIDAKNERMLAINRKAGFAVKSYVMVRDLD